jgi:hypothetical protein
LPLRCPVTLIWDSNCKMNEYPCIDCGSNVRPRQEALQFDQCSQWQHRLCNTGKTFLSNCIAFSPQKFFILCSGVTNYAMCVCVSNWGNWQCFQYTTFLDFLFIINKYQTIVVSTEYCLIQVTNCSVPSTEMSRSVPNCPVPSTEMSKSVPKCPGTEMSRISFLYARQNTMAYRCLSVRPRLVR